MKKNTLLIVALLPLFFVISCLSKTGSKGGQEAEPEEQAAPDTIKRYYSGNILSSEVTFRNGVRHGLTKTYYATGKLYQTFWYNNGVKEDTAVMYYEDGMRVFRKTPFRRDTMHGVQIQYYKSGRIRAKLEFVDGLRKPYLEEFKSDGTPITDYASLVVETSDNYKQNGTYTIKLSLNKKNVKANFYRGGYQNGLFNPKAVAKINDSDYTGVILLRKTADPAQNYVEVIAEILTPLGNRLLEYRKIDLPYNDLK